MGWSPELQSLPSDRIESIRQFNRFYTQKIGVLRDEYLDSKYSLTEVRVLYELAHRQHQTASELKDELGLDAGYLSRILGAFEKKGLLKRTPSLADRRQTLLELTRRGRDVIAPLESQARAGIAALLDGLSESKQRDLTQAMQTIEQVLNSSQKQPQTVLLRDRRPGDLGWVIERHGALYSTEYGWTGPFEALVAKIAAEFLEKYDPTRERCWIAERDGERVGSVFLVKASNSVAKLRLLLVEPHARGLGLGERLVSECIRFARSAGYSHITLWTQSILQAARHIYQKAGFKLVKAEPHRSFGHDLIGETWQLDLTSTE